MTMPEELTDQTQECEDCGAQFFPHSPTTFTTRVLGEPPSGEPVEPNEGNTFYEFARCRPCFELFKKECDERKERGEAKMDFLVGSPDDLPDELRERLKNEGFAL